MRPHNHATPAPPISPVVFMGGTIRLYHPSSIIELVTNDCHLGCLVGNATSHLTLNLAISDFNKRIGMICNNRDPEKQLLARFVGFAKSQSSSANEIVQTCFSVALDGSRSSIGKACLRRNQKAGVPGALLRKAHLRSLRTEGC
ncbi:hypothetical protein CAPTEDRAFT_212528 [Capitella teleta]|uniref:Uncharacterized protein n=1 Tax=Capitella teleta TaxID=283909 RepID=R7TVX3_CAPTE|nr:hypothetical protein CAPTEDRAFT_212528 [Capitella teleta]|eukprot:ELT98058.1 hypothetical protein CAPTEDRAFT_212528 [Capitella teleta]